MGHLPEPAPVDSRQVLVGLSEAEQLLLLLYAPEREQILMAVRHEAEAGPRRVQGQGQLHVRVLPVGPLGQEVSAPGSLGCGEVEEAGKRGNHVEQ